MREKIKPDCRNSQAAKLLYMIYREYLSPNLHCHCKPEQDKRPTAGSIDTLLLMGGNE